MSLSDKHLRDRTVRIVEPDPYVVVSTRIRRSTFERVNGVARYRNMKPAALMRKLVERGVKRAPTA